MNNLIFWVVMACVFGAMDCQATTSNDQVAHDAYISGVSLMYRTINFNQFEQMNTRQLIANRPDLPQFPVWLKDGYHVQVIDHWELNRRKN